MDINDYDKPIRILPGKAPAWEWIVCIGMPVFVLVILLATRFGPELSWIR